MECEEAGTPSGMLTCLAQSRGAWRGCDVPLVAVDLGHVGRDTVRVMEEASRSHEVQSGRSGRARAGC